MTTADLIMNLKQQLSGQDTLTLTRELAIEVIKVMERALPAERPPLQLFPPLTGDEFPIVAAGCGPET